MNGLALAARARALRPGLRVLLASGHSDDNVAWGAVPPSGGGAPDALPISAIARRRRSPPICWRC